MRDNSAAILVGIFDHYNQAAEAIKDLWKVGFPQDHIDMVTGAGYGPDQATTEAEADNAAADGAVGGAISGAVVGAVAGAIAMVAMPALGAITVGGLLASMLGGGAFGAAGGTFLGPFVAMGLSEREAHHYSKELEENRTLIIVKEPSRLDEARTILERHGGRFLSAKMAEHYAHTTAGV